MRNALASEAACGDNADAIEARRLATQISIKVSKYFANIKTLNNLVRLALMWNFYCADAL